ncbi:amidohydrolase family protein [Pontibacter anaerobius]|uniref:Amidohydrolase family protein n=1 Tax=Pontibacter anaerobius TaxID=2993940 RepID=A0ABT3RCM9_9BACT|nr:amidohydrolase family protein [Pontibacter anaerobius]MCX2739520.1 amidohydrolase family protein [Pontibacter anaerobius]
MQRIDAHQHFWQYDALRESWITEEMAAIRRDFMPRDLEPLLQRHRLDGCVLVQSAEPEEENDFLLDLASAHDFIKGVVGWVDFKAADVEERLSHLSQFSKLKGFRYILQGALDRALMLHPSFKRGIGKLRNFGFTYDILIYPDQLRYIPEFVAAFPDQPFVIDHLAKPNIRDKQLEGWSRELKKIAQHQNVLCKVSGMVTEADWQNWRREDFVPYLDTVTDAFGTERLMYGSDWPVCLVAASYGEVLGVVEEYYSAFSQQEQAAVFGVNATRFYNLS